MDGIPAVWLPFGFIFAIPFGLVKVAGMVAFFCAWGPLFLCLALVAH